MRVRPRRSGAVVVASLALVLGGLGTVAVVRGIGPSSRPALAPSSSAPTHARPAVELAAPSADRESLTAKAAATSAAATEAPLSSAVAAAPSPSVASSVPTPPGSGSAACVGALFPERSFAPDAGLGFVCTEADPRKVAIRLRSEIARQGLLRGETTEAMRLWALLSWYELALVAVAKGACCTTDEARAIELPPSVGACPDLRANLTELAGAVAAGADPNPSIAGFRLSSTCIERGYRLNAALSNPYPFKGPVGSGSESAFRRVLERTRREGAR